ncbi:hypothetical protein GCM10020218_053580 [Dactylosporangium vinaceum]
MHVRDRLVDEGCTLFSTRIERDARAGLTVGGPPDLLAKMAVHLRSITFADVYANPGAYDETSYSTPSPTPSCALVYGPVPDGVTQKTPADAGQ